MTFRLSLSGLLLLNNRKYLSTIPENNEHADILDKWNLDRRLNCEIKSENI